jgi:hypothetical protein
LQSRAQRGILPPRWRSDELDESVGSHETTWKQAQFLMDKLMTPPSDRARVGAAFKHLAPKDVAAPGAR